MPSDIEMDWVRIDNLKWISLARRHADNDDTSSLLVYDDRLEVVGVLPHNSQIVPASVEDARLLVTWLEQWIAAQ